MSSGGAGKRKLGGCAGRGPIAALRPDLPGRLAECRRQPDHRDDHAKRRPVARRLSRISAGRRRVICLGSVLAGASSGVLALRFGLRSRDRGGGTAVRRGLRAERDWRRRSSASCGAHPARVRRRLGRRAVFGRHRLAVRQPAAAAGLQRGQFGLGHCGPDRPAAGRTAAPTPGPGGWCSGPSRCRARRGSRRLVHAARRRRRSGRGRRWRGGSLA